MRYLTFVFFFVAALSADAGVTIHYTGKAKSVAAVADILDAAKDYAALQKWKVEDASALKGTLRRMDGEKEKSIETKVSGIRITVAPMCEPLFLQFGDDLVMHDFVKTQFSGADVHIAVIGLFEILQSKMRSLSIVDEGEYWEGRDRKSLLRNLESVDLMIAEIKKQHPEARGPIVMSNGRIIDIAK